MDLIPWALVALLYALGGIVIYQDMKEADRNELKIESSFEQVAYALCVGLWPVLVLIILIHTLIDKIKERRS